MELKDLIGQPISNIKCSKCKSTNTYDTETTVPEFSPSGQGITSIKCKCDDCGNLFNVKVYFEYSVTDIYYV